MHAKARAGQMRIKRLIITLNLAVRVNLFVRQHCTKTTGATVHFSFLQTSRSVDIFIHVVSCYAEQFYCCILHLSVLSSNSSIPVNFPCESNPTF